MKPPSCPSCEAVLAKMPQRKTKCKCCGEIIFVKKTPDDRTPRLMNGAQAIAAEKLWEAYATKQNGLRVSAFARRIGIPEDEVARAERECAFDAQQLMQALIVPLALQDDRDAVWFMWAYSNEPRAWHLALVQLDLDIMRERGYSSARVHAIPPAHSPCVRCARIDGQLVLTSDPAAQIVGAGCSSSRCHMSIGPNLQEKPIPPSTRRLRPHQERMLRAAEKSGGLLLRFPVPQRD